MSKAVYSRALEKYVKSNHPILRSQPYYWNQGIGKTKAK